MSTTLTTTSYAILGLLAVKPWTTYELTQQMDRSLGRIWPRAQSKLYEEPKKLVALGLARATEERVGKRPRTRYAITPKGRRALARWLAEPSQPPSLEAEHLVKMFFAEHGTKADALATLAASLAAGEAYLAGAAPFQQRAAQTMLVGTFLSDLYALVAEWADWASEQVERWPDDPTQALPHRADFEAVVERARRQAETLGADGEVDTGELGR